MITAQQLSRSYGDALAVDGVSFHIGRGEIVGLLGHNGAGKSTIMKMLTGYLEPDAGRIEIAGRELAADPEAAQSLIGYLPENCPLYPEMSVIDFLDYTATLRGVPYSQRAQAVLRALAQTELQDRALDAIATLSRGYRQRVGVAQALLHEPQILILDEPTNGLDPGQIEHMRVLIRELGRQATVIVSTHILQEVEAVCDRVLILRRGRLALDARLAELTSGRGLLLTTDAPPAELTARLQSLPQLAAIEPLAESGPHAHYRLLPADDREGLAPLVAQAVVEQGWQLFGLQPEERTLERVFHDMTRGEVRDHAA